MTLIHIMQGLNLFVFIILVFQIRMLQKSRKKLMAEISNLDNLMKQLNSMRGEDERR